MQEKREGRSEKYSLTLEHKNVSVIKRNDGTLSLIDVAYCGYCGEKLTNGTKYSYWKIKDSGEKKASKTPMYRCQSAQRGIPHIKYNHFRASTIEDIVFKYVIDYIEKLQENEDIMQEIEANQNQEKRMLENELKKLNRELENIIKGIEVMRSHIPDAMTENYPLSVEEIANAIHSQQAKEQVQRIHIEEKQAYLEQMTVSNHEWEELKKNIPTWKQIFKEADCATQRVLVNKLIERVEITKEQIVIRFKIKIDDFLPRPRININDVV